MKNALQFPAALWLLLALSGSTWAQSPAPVAPAPAPSVTASSDLEDFPVRALQPKQLSALRQGGFVLYMRHGTTDSSRPDQADLNLNDCTTQRPLNDAGRQVARDVGRAIKRAQIPVSEVWSSPMCRTRETAQLAFGNDYKVDPLLMYTSHMTAAQKQPIVENTRRLLSTPVAPGSNRVLVAHAPNMADAMGYFVKPEGTVVVIRPLGQGKFEYVASIPPADWAKLSH